MVPAKFIFPDFPGQNESFFLMNWFMQKYHWCQFSITLKTKATEKIQKWRYK